MVSSRPEQMSEYRPVVDYNTNRSSPIRWILSHAKRHKILFIFVIIFTLLNSVLQSFIPGYIGNIVDLYQNNDLNLNSLTSLSINVLILGISAGIVILFRNFAVEFIGQRMEKESRDELYSSLLGKSLTFHDKQKIGDLMARAATDVRQLNFMMNPGFNLVFQSIIGIIIPIIFIGFIDYRLLLVPVLYIIIFLIVLKRYNDTLSPWAMKSRRAVSQINARLNETISGMHVVRGSAHENREKEIFENNILEFKKAQVKLGEIQAKYWPLLLFGLATAIGIYHGILLVQTGTITLGDLIQFALLFQLLRFPTFINIFAITVLTLGVAAAERILELLEGDSEIDLNPDGFAKMIEGEIEFDDVTFGYAEDTPVVKNISFKIYPGQTVALVGQTGAGKTTLTKLLARLYGPQEGQIRIDGVKLSEWSINSLRSQMALVEQDIFLFSKTIKENILLGKPTASMQEIEEAARLAHAHEFITNFPDGYDTEIGERGTTLSGGQKQRIAIARAILKDPRILILDDASSAIDSKTEDEINRAIRDVLKNRVSFLITHRMAQIRKADLIILMDQGEIIDKGDHQYLIANSPIYRKIFSTFDNFDQQVVVSKEEN